jgi:hypothetical protein
MLPSRRVAVVLGTSLLAASTPAMARTFTDILGTPLSRAIGDEIGTAVAQLRAPVIAASAGIVFTFDPATGAFERQTSIVGQLFLERAEPVGRGRWNLSLNYERVKIDRIDGHDIEGLSDTSPPIVDPNTGNRVEFPRFGIDLETHEVTTSVTYGLTDDLDVNLTVPVLFSEFRVRLTQVSPGSGQGEKHFADSATQLGVGDVFLRGKYRLLDRDWLRAALGLVLRLPTGEKENFQGTGTLEVGPMLYASTKRFQVSRFVHLQPYVNAGVGFDTEDVGASEPRWGVGIDAALGDVATLAAAVLGRHPLRRVAPPGFFDFARADGSVRPLFGLTGARSDYYDFSFGGRVDIWHDTIFGFANLIVPLNDEGVRSDFIPTFGVEVSF